MKCDIFYKSYAKDFKWLVYSLRSISKFVTGYNDLHIVVPEWDRIAFHSLVSNNAELFRMRGIKVHYTLDYGNGYLYQQFIKMSAHKYCNADYILYADSDCIFDKPTDVRTLIKDGKPEILYTDYSKVGDAICWKECTDKFMNEPQQYEFMRRLPLVYYRSTIETIYNLVPNLEQMIMDSGRFSEFNALGAWAFRHEPDKYSFINTDNWTYSPPISRQFWSHSGLNGNDMIEINKILA